MTVAPWSFVRGWVLGVWVLGVWALTNVGLVAYAGSATAADRPTIAVVPVEALNLADTARQALRALLVERMRETTAFDVVEAAGPLASGASDCVREASCLQRAARRLDAPRLVQLSVAGLGGTYVLRLTLYDGRSGTRRGSWQEVLSTLAPERVSRALDRMIAGFDVLPRDRAPPWYRRWWVWTTVAGVVAAGTLTAVLLTTRSGGVPYDEIITPPSVR